MTVPALKSDKKTRADVAQEHLQQLRNLIYEQGLSIVEIGRLLLIFKAEKLYEELGHENFRQFIADADIGIAPSTAYNIMRIYQLYVMKFGFTAEQLSQVPWGKLQALAPIIDGKDKSAAEEWLNKAKVLGAGDFHDEVVEYKKNKGQTKRLPYPKIRRCADCGGWRIEPEPHTICRCVDLPKDAKI